MTLADSNDIKLWRIIMKMKNLTGFALSISIFLSCTSFARAVEGNGSSGGGGSVVCRNAAGEINQLNCWIFMKHPLFTISGFQEAANHILNKLIPLYKT